MCVLGVVGREGGRKMKRPQVGQMTAGSICFINNVYAVKDFFVIVMSPIANALVCPVTVA